jgi:hypothetical protein
VSSRVVGEGPDLPAFVHPLSSLTEPTADAEWEPVDIDEINRRCDEIRHARAVAEVTGRDYIID